MEFCIQLNGISRGLWYSGVLDTKTWRHISLVDSIMNDDLDIQKLEMAFSSKRTHCLSRLAAVSKLRIGQRWQGLDTGG